jgi:hypothetical protein
MFVSEEEEDDDETKSDTSAIDAFHDSYDCSNHCCFCGHHHGIIDDG